MQNIEQAIPRDLVYELRGGTAEILDGSYKVNFDAAVSGAKLESVLGAILQGTERKVLQGEAGGNIWGQDSMYPNGSFVILGDHNMATISPTASYKSIVLRSIDWDPEAAKYAVAGFPAEEFFKDFESALKEKLASA